MIKVYFNGQKVIPILNGKRIRFYHNLLVVENRLITADGLQFLTANGNKFLVKEG